MKKIIGKKFVSIVVIIAFLFYTDVFLMAQSEDEIVNQFHRARARYTNGQYQNARQRIERVIGIISEKQVDRNDILGMCYLLLGAIYEKESKPILAEENYKKAVNTYGITLVDKVDLESLELYRKVVKGEGKPQPEPAGGTIEKPGAKKKGKKKFPWLIVAGAVVVVTIALILLLKKKKKTYTLNVTVGDGINGSPEAGTHTHNGGDQVSYNYTAAAGYGNPTVLLDGQPAASSGTVTMNANHTLVVSADALAFETDVNQLDIPEGSSRTFNVRLTAQPAGDVQVIVRHVAGDTDISITNGSDFIFTTSNWDSFKTVSVLAAADDDTANGTATLRISATAAGIPDKDITIGEIDGSSLGFITNSDDVTVPENGVASFRVKLSFMPNADVAVVVEKAPGGDENITVRSPNFTIEQAEWDKFHEVVLQASGDTDTTNGTAQFIIKAPDLPNLPDKTITATESDTDKLHFVTSTNSITVDELSSGQVQVSLSAQPTGTVTASVARVSGDSDITVSPETLTFTTSNWGSNQAITISAADDPDIENGEAVIRISASNVDDNKDISVFENDNDSIDFETETSQLTVLEGNSASFGVRLTAQPVADLVVTVAKTGGAENITVGTSQLTFTSSNWDQYKDVQVFAGRDEDEADGTATISITHRDITTKTVTVTEDDQGPGDNPTAAIQSPQNGDVLSDENPVIISAVVNDDFGVKEVEFYIDGTRIDVVPFTGATPSYSWLTKEVTPGAHTLKVIAIDFSNHQGESPEVNVTVSDTLPTVTIDPLADATVSGTVSFNINAADFRGVQSINFSLGETELTPWEEGPSEDVEFTFQLDTTLYANGTYTFKAIAVDTGTQESVPAEITITIAN